MASMGSALRALLHHKPDADRIAPALAYGESAVVQCSADLLCFYRLIGQAVAESSGGASDEAANITPQPQVGAPHDPSNLRRRPLDRSCKCVAIEMKIMFKIRLAATTFRCVCCMTEVDLVSRIGCVWLRRQAVWGLSAQEQRNSHETLRQLAGEMAMRGWTTAKICSLPFGIALPLQLVLLRCSQLCQPGDETLTGSW